jgi:predicted choloylglycine hydrolase
VNGKVPLQPAGGGAWDLGVTLGTGPTMGRREVRVFEFTGDHYEMGYQQGLQLREAISFFAAHLPEFEVMRAAKPPMVPTRAYIYYLANRSIKEFLPDLINHYPNQRKRLEGLAKGSQLEESLFLLMTSAEVLLTQVNYRMGACTAAGIAANRCAQEEPVIIKNFDYPVEFQPFYITRHSQPLEGYHSLDVSVAPMLGCHDGINDQGLAVSYNYGFGTDLPKSMVSVSLVAQEILERCATVEEAVAYAVSSKRAGGALLLFADAGGNMASVELSPNFSGVREAEDGLLINTNHYLSNEMTPYGIPSNAYYTARNPHSLRGTRVHESSEIRYSRVQQLLDVEEPLSLKDLVSIFSDHGEGGRGNDNSVCRHGEYFTTTCSVIMFPASRRMLVTYGNPCDSIYTDFPDVFHAPPAE